MHNKSAILILLLICGLCSHIQLQAQQAEDSAKINAEAANPDFIHVSLIKVAPGKEMISAYGHIAIRMQCPSKHLDYCFTFESEDNWINKFKFFFGSIKAGYTAAATDLFIKNYQQEGRGITEYKLNLTPKEKQKLWKNLDEQVESGLIWEYNYTTVQCTSMVAYILDKSLINENIKFGKLAYVLTHTFGDYHNIMTKNQPWLRLFTYIKYYSYKDRLVDPEGVLTPDLMIETYQRAFFVDNTGHKRPVLLGKGKTLLANTLIIKPTFITPTLVGAILLGVLLAFFGWRIHKKRKISFKHQ